MRKFNRTKTDTILYWIFVCTGLKFFLDYIVPTNMASKNPVIYWLWSLLGGNHIWNYDLQGRIYACYAYGGIHLFYAIMMGVKGHFFYIGNILVNIYPILIQCYIYYRCKTILKLRKHDYRIA